MSDSLMDDASGEQEARIGALLAELTEARAATNANAKTAGELAREVRRLRRALERIADDDCGSWDEAMRYARQVLLG
jgi:hypothetical protein